MKLILCVMCVITIESYIYDIDFMYMSYMCAILRMIQGDIKFC